MPASVVQPALVLASFYGYAVVQIILEHNEDIATAQHSGGTSAVQAAIQGVTRGGVETASRVHNAKQVLTLLNEHGAQMSSGVMVQSELQKVTRSLNDDGLAEGHLLAHIEKLRGMGRKGRGRRHARKTQKRKFSNDL
eukprot:COSAG02_NODE_9327_length_2254_cov_4.858469_2_plen_138_part_00